MGEETRQVLIQFLEHGLGDITTRLDKASSSVEVLKEGATKASLSMANMGKAISPVQQLLSKLSADGGMAMSKIANLDGGKTAQLRAELLKVDERLAQLNAKAEKFRILGVEEGSSRFRALRYEIAAAEEQAGRLGRAYAESVQGAQEDLVSRIESGFKVGSIDYSKAWGLRDLAIELVDLDYSLKEANTRATQLQARMDRMKATGVSEASSSFKSLAFSMAEVDQKIMDIDSRRMTNLSAEAVKIREEMDKMLAPTKMTNVFEEAVDDVRRAEREVERWSQAVAALEAQYTKAELAGSERYQNAARVLNSAVYSMNEAVQKQLRLISENKVTETNTQAFDADRYAAQVKRLQDINEEMRKTRERQARIATAAQDALRYVADEAAAMKNLSSASRGLLSAEEAANMQASRAATVAREISKIGDAERMASQIGAGGTNRRLAQVYKDVVKTEAAISAMNHEMRMFQAAGITDADPHVQRLNKDLETARARLAAYRKEMVGAFGNSMLNMLGLTAERTTLIGRAFGLAGNAVKSAGRLYSEAMKNISDKLYALSLAAGEAGTAIASLGSMAAMTGTVVSAAFGAIGSAVSAAGLVISKVFGAVATAALNAVQAAAHKLWNTMKSFASGVLNKIADGFKAAANGAKKLVSAFLGMGSSAKKQTSAVKKLADELTSLWRLAKMKLKRMFLAAVFEDVKYDMGQIAQIFEPFNRAISDMIDSAKWLGAQLTAAFAPIVSVVGPVLSYLMDAATAVSDRLAQFAARLTGNEMYVRAIKGQSDYAASVRESTGDVNDATKAVKEYENQVLSFDQINKLTGKDDGTEIGIAKPTFEMTQTDATKINTIADSIWDAFTKHDFFAAGQNIVKAVKAVADGIAEAIGGLADKGKIDRFTSNVADVVNGISFRVLADSAGLGRDIGRVVNTVVKGFNQLTTKIKAYDIGRSIAQTIKHSIENIDWAGIGSAIVNGAQFVLQAITGLFSGGATSELSASVTDFIDGVKKAFDPEIWAECIHAVAIGIADLGNALLNGVHGILHDADGNSVGDTIGGSLADGLKRFNWPLLGETLVEGIQFGLDFLTGFLNSEAGTEMRESLNGFMHGAIEALEPDKWSDAVSTVIQKLVDLFTGQVIKDDDRQTLSDKISTFLKETVEKIDFDGIWKKIKSAADRIKGYLEDAIKWMLDVVDSSLGEWMWSNHPLLARIMGFTNPNEITFKMDIPGGYSIDADGTAKADAFGGDWKGPESAWSQFWNYSEAPIAKFERTIEDGFNMLVDPLRNALDNLTVDNHISIDGREMLLATSSSSTTLSRQYNSR